MTKQERVKSSGGASTADRSSGKSVADDQEQPVQSKSDAPEARPTAAQISQGDRDGGDDQGSWLAHPITENIIQLLLLVAVIASALIGHTALEAYQQANRVTMRTTLDELDGKIYDFLIDDGEAFELFFMYWEPLPDHQATTKEAYRAHANSILSGVIGRRFDAEWNSVTQLYGQISRLYSRSDCESCQEDYRRLMKAFLLSEKMIFTAYAAFESWREGIITETDWHDFAAYFEDFAHNPIFLSAIDLNHQLCYFDEDFAAEIFSFIGDDPQVRELYPEIQACDWATAPQCSRESSP